MRAINHALTGAVVGLTVPYPAVALPLAFVSHFVLDAIPHYDDANDMLTRLRSRQFKWLLVVDPLLCAGLVGMLAAAHPSHWVLAAVAAFVATSPDLLAYPKFALANRENRLPTHENWFARFHHRIQWWTGPAGMWVELTWLLVAGGLVLVRL